MTAKTCPACHGPIPADAPGGLCPACVLRDAGEPPSYGKGAPPVGEIAAAFPALEILDLIGQGGMGFVYKVRQPGLDRIVALKILSPELGRDPAFAERFAREARTLGKLHHPNIVTVFEHGESGGFFYLLMEYVDGVNLRQAMRAGRFTPQQALAIVPGICDALQAAHAQGIWHRDIKPENILLDRDGRVKIADFGIARIVGDPQRDFTLTLTGNALGSAGYMAPEQHEKPHDVDHRADIYSLGVVIYEMLTGELPLGRFPLPSQRAEVNARIDEIVLRTLEKERDLRQQSAEEVKTEVEGAGTGASATLHKENQPAVTHAISDHGYSRLSLGLFLASVLGTLILLSVSRRDEFSLMFGAVCMLVAAGLAVVSWRQRISQVVLLIVSASLVAFGVLTIINQAHERSALLEARARQVEERAKLLATAAKQVEAGRHVPQIGEQSFLPRDGKFNDGADLEAPEYNFSTPRDTIESMIKAANKGDVEAFKRGLSKEVLLENPFYKAHDLAERMREWEGVIYGHQLSEDGDHAEVRLRDSKTNEAIVLPPLVRENGEWKLTLTMPSDEP